MVSRKYSKEELAKRGEAMYSTSIANVLHDTNPTWIVAIDVDSGDYEVDEDMLDAVERLQERRADSQIWIRRVDSGPVMRFGACSEVAEP